MHICYSKWGPTSERDLGCLVSLSWGLPWNSTRFGLFWTKTTPDRYPKDMFQTYVLALTKMWYMFHYHQSTHHQHRSMQNNLIACRTFPHHLILRASSRSQGVVKHNSPKENAPCPVQLRWMLMETFGIMGAPNTPHVWYMYPHFSIEINQM